MKKLIIHAGFAKTGTTSIQNLLKHNEVALSEHGILYPEASRNEGVGTAHHEIFLSLLPEKHPIRADFWGAKPKKTFCHYLEQIGNEAEEKNCHTILLSSEVAFHCLAHFPNIEERFQNFDLLVLLFIRRFSDHIKSLYSQHVKHPGRYLSPREFYGYYTQSDFFNFDLVSNSVSKRLGSKGFKICEFSSSIGPIDSFSRAALPEDLELREGEDKRFNSRDSWLRVRLSQKANKIESCLSPRGTPVRRLIWPAIAVYESALARFGVIRSIDERLMPFTSRQLKSLDRSYLEKIYRMRSEKHLEFEASL